MLVQSLPIQVDIVSAEAAIFSGLAFMVTASGKLGQLGITHGHSPLLTLLKPGEIRLLLAEAKEQLIYVNGGILEVQPHGVTVLADIAARAEDLDEAAALAAQARAEQQLVDYKTNPKQVFNYKLATTELAQATAQLKMIQDLRKKVKGHG